MELFKLFKKSPPPATLQSTTELKDKKTDHLMSVEQAKQIIKSHVEKELKAYEARLEKPFFERAAEYLETGFGKAGYDRRKSFLTAMKNVNTTAELIDLTNQPLYQKGEKFPLFLKEQVLGFCGFDSTLIDGMEATRKMPYLEKRPVRAGTLMALSDMRERVINDVYHNILESTDYGYSDLQRVRPYVSPSNQGPR